MSRADVSIESPITERKIPGTSVPDVTRAEAGGETRRFMTRVAVTTAMLAALASIATLFSSSDLNRAMMDQIKSSDQWAFYQAKGVKLEVLTSRMELLKTMGKEPDATDVERAARYGREQDEISAAAKELEVGAEAYRRSHMTLARASAAFQVAIALAAVALLSKRAVLWYLSMALGVAGVVLFGVGMV